MFLSTVNYLILTIFQHMSKCNLTKFCKFYNKNLKIKVVFIPFQVPFHLHLFNLKVAISMSLKSFTVYKFVCAGCTALQLAT